MSRLGDLVAALGLLLLIEGLIMFTAPGIAKKAADFFLSLSASYIQKMGLVTVLTGLAILWGIGWF